MESYQFLINNYIRDNNCDNDIIKLKDNLYKIGILLKDYPEDNLIILYNRYENKNKGPIELECRSVILNRSNYEIVCYTCTTPIYNMDALNYMVKNSNDDKMIFKCYEGSLLSLFNFQDKWYLSSRKCLDSKSSIINGKSHYDMFMEVLLQDNHNSFEDFTKLLDKKYTYHFVLIHHENDHIVNYTKTFGKNFKKLCFIFARDVENHKEINSEDIDSLILSDNIFLPKKLEDTTFFDKTNQLLNLTEQPEEEGIIIKMNNSLLKLQTMAYQFYKVIGPEKNLYRGFIRLYQANRLNDYFNKFPNAEKYKKIVNPINTTQSFDTVGIIDAVFKVCTSELFELFNILWDSDDNHNNTELYNILPKEYKNILFHLRGIQNKLRGKNKKNSIRVQNIYNYLKIIETREFEDFLRCRKLMFNWIKLDGSNKNLKTFSKSLYYSDKVYYKLIAIYTNKLFPDIMPDDLPVKIE